MPSKPSWQDLYGGPIPTNLPPVPPNVTPRVDEPECPRDCSGRHGVDALIECRTCGPVYRDWWHEYKVNRGVNFHVLEQLQGAPVLSHAHMPCPLCGGALTK